MAILRDMNRGRDLTVRGRALVGRSARADVPLAAPAASSEHASISWDGAEWSLRDLKSRNGTKINDTPASGRTWRLVVGDVITFGDPDERWLWADRVPPRAAAVRADGLRIEASKQLLWLPGPETPEVTVYATDAGWVLERDALIRSVRDGETVHLDGQQFSLELPDLDANSSRTRTLVQTRDIRNAAATFGVSLDEEHVELTLAAATVSKRLPGHAFHYMLLLLGRARLRDKLAGLREEDSGWLHVDELARQLGTEPLKLNVDICRARKLVDELDWFRNPEDLVERRRTSKQLRFGISNLTIESASLADQRADTR